MKNLTYRFLGLMLVAVALLFTACGGGSGGSSDGKTSSADLNQETLDRMGDNIAKTIPGCVYTSNKRGFILSDNDDLLMAVEPVSNVVNQLRNSIRRVNEETETKEGSCGGTAVISNTHFKGSDDMRIDLTNYCMDNETTGDKLYANGVLEAHINGKPSPSGPIPEDINISTGSSGISIRGQLDGVDTNYVVSLDDVNVTLNGEEFQKITADEIKVVNNDNVFKITNLNGTVKMGEYGYVEIENVTYHYPKAGTMSISTSKIPLSENATGSATITATSKGKSVNFTSDNLSSGIFRSEAGGLDCSKLLE